MAITQYYSTHGYVCSVWVQRIQYARSKSDCVSRAEGSFVQREKKMQQEEKGLNFSFFHNFKILSPRFNLCLLLSM